MNPNTFRESDRLAAEFFSSPAAAAAVAAQAKKAARPETEAVFEQMLEKAIERAETGETLDSQWLRHWFTQDQIDAHRERLARHVALHMQHRETAGIRRARVKVGKMVYPAVSSFGHAVAHSD